MKHFYILEDCPQLMSIATSHPNSAYAEIKWDFATIVTNVLPAMPIFTEEILTPSI